MTPYLPITMSNIRAELGLGLPVSLSNLQVRELCGAPSGTVSMAAAYKTQAFNITVGEYVYDTGIVYYGYNTNDPLNPVGSLTPIAQAPVGLTVINLLNAPPNAPDVPNQFGLAFSSSPTLTLRRITCKGRVLSGAPLSSGGWQGYNYGATPIFTAADVGQTYRVYVSFA